jgi:hypothetical protein
VGLILIYLTAGYFIGGTWADRSPKYETLYQILAWASLAVGLIPIASRPILRLAADAFDHLQMGVLIGSFSVVMVLFVIPVTLIGTASPLPFDWPSRIQNKREKPPDESTRSQPWGRF